ncbi:MAG: iron ABC transporter permease [Acidobacteria bacterium]|nr:MAG: iron ABC transporter permease [Acidobacteriota bacterium]
MAGRRARLHAGARVDARGQGGTRRGLAPAPAHHGEPALDRRCRASGRGPRFRTRGAPWRDRTVRADRLHPAAVTAGLAALLAVAAAAGLLFGGAPGVGPAEIVAAIAGQAPPDPIARALLFEVRLPRVLLLALAGAALAASGAALQACLENPLADPGLLGLSGGAAVGAVAAHAGGLAARWPASVPAAAFGGALAAVAVVYALAHAAGRPTTGTLLLTGVAVGSLASSLVSVMLLSTGSHRVHEIFAWLLGSAEGASWDEVRLATLPVLAGLGALLALGRLVDALALGEEHAAGVGVDLLKGRAVLLAAVSLTAGSAVSVVGPIGFVGLMVPHMLRGLTGAAARALLPASAIGGAALLVAADLLARTASRRFEVPVGVVTALLGVPFFLFLLHRSRTRH